MMLDTNAGRYVADFKINVVHGDWTVYAGKCLHGKVSFFVMTRFFTGMNGLSVNVIGQLTNKSVNNLEQTITIGSFGPEGAADSGDMKNEILDYGNHAYDFCIPLPHKMVSSLDTVWLEVEYTVEVTFTDYIGRIFAVDSMPLKIHDVLDLNLNRDQNKLKVEVKKYLPPRNFLSNWVYTCLDIASLECICSIPKTGYVPHEEIKIGICLPRSRLLSHSVNRMSVYINQTLRWRKEFREMNVGGKLLSREDLRQMGNVGRLISVNIPVPDIPPTGNYPNAEVEISYSLYVWIQRRGLDPIIVTVPIVIGNRPLISDADFHGYDVAGIFVAD